MRIGYKRDGRYPRRFSVNVTAAVGAKLDAAATRYGIAPATLARDALERGLTLMLEARRRRGGTRAGATPDAAATRYGIAPTLAEDSLERGLTLMLEARRRRGGTPDE